MSASPFVHLSREELEAALVKSLAGQDVAENSMLDIMMSEPKEARRKAWAATPAYSKVVMGLGFSIVGSVFLFILIAVALS